MIRVTLPRRRFGTTDYPNLDPDATGRVIPVGYGTLVGIPATEIDTTTDRFKILDQAISELTAIRSATKSPLVKDLDYTEALSTAEFTLLKPVYLVPTSTYYVAIDADYPESGTNYVSLQRNSNNYADGTSYTIDSSEAWTPDVDDYDLLFTVYGKQSASAAEEVIATNTTSDVADVGLKDAEARTRIGFSFMPSVTAYMTRVVVYITKHGTTTGYGLRATLYSDTAGTQLDQDGNRVLISSGVSSLNLTRPERNSDEVLECDVKAPGTEMNQAADILEDVIATVLGKSAAILDATELANLATHKTEVLRVFLSDQIEFRDFLAKLEAGQLWKFVPLPGDSPLYGTVVPETGEPANLLTLRDHDFLSFRMEYDVKNLKQKQIVFYGQDPADAEDYPSVEVSSDVAKFFYMNEESQSTETFLSAKAAAETRAAAGLARYEVPIIRAIFEVHAKGVELVPWRDKVKLYRTRAPYTGGTLNGVLFRIVKLIKKPATGVVEITAEIWGNSAT